MSEHPSAGCTGITQHQFSTPIRCGQTRSTKPGDNCRVSSAPYLLSLATPPRMYVEIIDYAILSRSRTRQK